MRTIKMLFEKKDWTKVILGITTCMLVFCLTGIVSEAAEGKITADTAKIRKEASTDSEVIGSTSKGKKVDIVGGVKDASGTVWYKVPNGNNTYGYIRSDLIETSDNVKITESTSGSSNASSGSSSKPADTVPTAIAEQTATVSQKSVRVRSGASTQHDTVAALPEGTVIKLIGQAQDSSGKTWYQMNCEHEGKNVEGYIRSDLIAIGAPVEGTEDAAEGGENAEGPAPGAENATGEQTGTENEPVQEPQKPAEPEHNDYEVVYNNDEYWLYINTDGTMMKVSEVLNVVKTANESYEEMQDQIKNNKIIIVILAVIIVILVIAVTILILKLKNLYFEEYYEEEEEIEEEPEPVKRKEKKSVVAEVEEPVRKKRAKQEAEQQTESSLGREKAERKQRAELTAAEDKPAPKKVTPRKAQNFLLDDDEFEFEFLNMDDKDL